MPLAISLLSVTRAVRVAYKQPFSHQFWAWGIYEGIDLLEKVLEVLRSQSTTAKSRRLLTFTSSESPSKSGPSTAAQHRAPAARGRRLCLRFSPYAWQRSGRPPLSAVV